MVFLLVYYASIVLKPVLYITCPGQSIAAAPIKQEKFGPGPL
jgi:hypothetical protein